MKLDFKIPTEPPAWLERSPLTLNQVMEIIPSEVHDGGKLTRLHHTEGRIRIYGQRNVIEGVYIANLMLTLDEEPILVFYIEFDSQRPTQMINHSLKMSWRIPPAWLGDDGATSMEATLFLILHQIPNFEILPLVI